MRPRPANHRQPGPPPGRCVTRGLGLGPCLCASRCLSRRGPTAPVSRLVWCWSRVSPPVTPCGFSCTDRAVDDTSTEFAPLAQRSTEIIEQIRDGDWGRVTVDWDETMRSKLPVEQLGEVWQVRLVMARTAPAAVTTARAAWRGCGSASTNVAVSLKSSPCRPRATGIPSRSCSSSTSCPPRPASDGQARRRLCRCSR